MKVESINRMAWGDVLVLCQKKSRFRKRVAENESKPLFVRTVNRLLDALFRDPCRGLTSEQLAMIYVRKFNDAHGIGTRISLGGGDTVWAGMKYQVEDRLPIIGIVYYEDGTGYVEQYKITSNGALEHLNPDNDVRHFGKFSTNYLPQRPRIVQLQDYIQRMPGWLEEIRNVMITLEPAK